MCKEDRFFSPRYVLIDRIASFLKLNKRNVNSLA
jgi:hypothetical protein